MGMYGIVASIGMVIAICVALVCWGRMRKLARENEQLRADIESRQQRPTVISHEIHTPLALINGAAELLAEGFAGSLTEQQRTFVTTITENTTQVINIAENFLIDTRLANNLPIAREAVDVREIVAQTARQMRRITPVPIHVDAVGGVLPVMADPQLIRQLVWNLVNNATRHAGADAIVTVYVRNAEGGGALLIVSDDGAGISSDDQEHMFEAFRTGSNRRPGTGIGMLVAQRIVEAHGGQILVDSLATRGTAIHVVLPAGNSGSEEEENE